jgi:hypothetical protein
LRMRSFPSLDPRTDEQKQKDAAELLRKRAAFAAMMSKGAALMAGAARIAVDFSVNSESLNTGLRKSQTYIEKFSRNVTNKLIGTSEVFKRNEIWRSGVC